MSEIVERMVRVRNDADVAMLNGDYQTARELYTRLLLLIESGAVEQEKDGHRFRQGDVKKTLLEIDRLEQRKAKLGTVRRVPVTFGLPDPLSER